MWKEYTPVVSSGYGNNQLSHDLSAVTWSIMTDTGGDLPCSSDLNDSLNGLSLHGEIQYAMNGYSYTTKKVDPYTCVQTNDITKQQRTLKSSVCVSSDVFPLNFFLYLIFVSKATQR